MSIILPIHVFFTALILQAMRTASLPEEAFYGYPLQPDEEYVYLGSRAEPNYGGMSSIKQSGETRRRSILDKNFARFGRSGAATKLVPVHADPETVNKLMYLTDDELDVPAFGRNARSGERSDQFIRFGRGRSDFVRFGRGGSHFVRFGRSTRSVQQQEKLKPKLTHANTITSKVGDKMADAHKMAAAKTAAREAKEERRKRAATDLDFYKKAGSNFVRFGRDRNDNFMRFGRMMNNYMPANQTPTLSLDTVHGEKTYNNTDVLMKYLQDLQGQQGQKDHELLIKILFNLLTKSHLQKNNENNAKEENRYS